MTESDGTRETPEDAGPSAQGDSASRGAPRSVMSRRQVIGRVSKGAVAAGVAAWVIPEIVVATPTAAGADSAPPSRGRAPGGSGGGGGNSQGGGGNSQGGGGNSQGGGGNSQGGGGNSQGGGAGGPANSANLSSMPGGASPGGAPGAGTAGGSSSGGLPFTGLDAERAAEIGAGLIAGGWALKHWKSRAGRRALAEGIESSGTEEPTV